MTSQTISVTRACCLVVVLLICVYGQMPSGLSIGHVTGQVFDVHYKEPIEYASIVVYRQSDSLQVTGTVTDAAGYFRLGGLRYGVYYVEVSFIGYESRTISNVRITPSAAEVDLGNIGLESRAISVEGTEVVAERPAVAYQIDKKVIDVSKQATTVSGTAVDVLENVPSVHVDIEGNVSLRGSENFTVLIDGRPTVLEPSDALQQIPANLIESIEIITNPSAKYDPDGISGIINIILKKKTMRGISGTMNLNVGMGKKYGGDMLLSHRRGIANLYFGADYNTRNFSGERRTENRTFSNDTTSYVNSDGDSQMRGNPYGLRGGVDLAFGAHDKLSFGGQYGSREMQHSSELFYEEWAEPGTGHELYSNHENSKFSHGFYSLTGDYLHSFSREDHEISAQGFFSRRESDHETTGSLRDTAGTITSGQQNIEAGSTVMARLKIDYKLPIGATNQIEAGYQGRIHRSEEMNEMYEYDSVTGQYDLESDFSHTTEYTRDIHALYTMYEGKFRNFGYQGGVRGEYVHRTVHMIGVEEDYRINRIDLFPSIHTSYKFLNGQQVMASYTRRIERPRGWWLEPFITWSDPYNVHQGNPDLKPEYIDSYELGYQTYIGASLFSTEAFYRITHNQVERVSSVYTDNVILHTVENVGTEYMFGTEFMLDLKMLKWWNMNLTASLYDHRIEGDLYGEPISEKDFNWSMRVSNELKLGMSTKIQLNGRYRSPSVSAQGQRDAFFMTDAAFKQELFGKKLSVTLQVRDLFGTGKFENTSEGEGFYSYSYSTRESPVVMLSVNYNFNNYKPDRRRDESEEEFEGMEEM